MRTKNIGFWLLIFSIITLIFSPAIIYPFFQDDFFVLVTTKISSISEIWRLFLPVSEAVYWRPLGIQLYFGLMQFFGLGRPIWFHLMSLAVHLLNTYLVYRLIRSLRAIPMLHRESVAISGVAKLAAFLWGTSPIHYFALGWAVNFSFILVVSWSLLSILSAIEGKKIKPILFFGLGLMTNEIAVIIPGLVFLVSGRKKLGTAAAMAVTAAVYAGWRWAGGVKIEGDYAVGLTTVALTLRWYGLWILGWSDIVRDYLSGIIFSPDFIKTFPAVVLVYIIELAAIVILLRRLFQRAAVLGFSWMLVGLLPVMFFSRHIYSHYATLAAIGVYWSAAEIASRRRQWMAATIIWLMVAVTTLGLNYQVSWMADHARNSIEYQMKMREYTDISMKEGILYIVSGDRGAETVLLNGWGVEYLSGVNQENVQFVSSVDEIPDIAEKKTIIFL